MRDLQNGRRELSDAELNAVSGGSGILDAIVGVATKIWNIMTGPAPAGVKGEATERQQGWIE